MKSIKLAPVMGVLVFIGLGSIARADEACPEPRFISAPVLDPFKAPKTATVPNVIVGDYSFVDSEEVFLPYTLCRVDKSLPILKQLQQCKNSRKGWLKL